MAYVHAYLVVGVFCLFANFLAYRRVCSRWTVPWRTLTMVLIWPVYVVVTFEIALRAHEADKRWLRMGRPS